ncbi:MAG: PIN domain-containing protein [Candidatus Obscuribacterales bacterium]|nr:PIN domain-containing protein [Candidatus Obscuribacterales bacterium]
MLAPGSTAFVDTNVLVEALLVKTMSALAIMDLAASEQLVLVTCEMVRHEFDKEILKRASRDGETLDALLTARQELVTRVGLKVHPNAPDDMVLAAWRMLLPTVRHAADIPVIAAAIEVRPHLILSGNRKHFNNRAAIKIGIPIFSCGELLDRMTPQGIKLKSLFEDDKP